MIDVFRSGVGYSAMCGGALLSGVIVRQGVGTLCELNAVNAEEIMRKAAGEIADGVVALGAGFRGGRLITKDTPKPVTLLVALFVLGLVVPPTTGKKI